MSYATDLNIAPLLEAHMPAGCRHIACAVSGGADSMALILLLHAWQKQYPHISITALTVDHQLRESSSREAHDVHRTLTDLAIPHVILTWKGEKPDSNIQAEARQARYRLMTEWCHQHKATCLLTAHHHGDQAETVLMRIVRGSGIDGMSAIAEASIYNDITVIRPLLHASKEALQAYLTQQHVAWIDDPTNTHKRYSRTHMRHVIQQADTLLGLSPELLTSRLASIAAHMQRAKNYLDAQVLDYHRDAVIYRELGYAKISYESFTMLHEEIGLRVLRQVLCHISGNATSPRFEHLESMYSALIAGALTAKTTLHGCIVWRRKGDIVVMREPHACIEQMVIDTPATYRWDGRFLCHVSCIGNYSMLTLKALGQRGWLSIQKHVDKEGYRIADKQVLYTLPALWHDDQVVAVPQLYYQLNNPAYHNITMESRCDNGYNA